MKTVILAELDAIRDAFKDIKAWEKELKLVQDKVNAFGCRCIDNNMGFKSGGKTFTLDDLLAKDEARINVLESNILYAKYKLKDLDIYLSKLDEDEELIIKEKYIENLNLKTVSFDYIAKKTNYSKSTVKRIYDRAIDKLTKEAWERIDIAQ